jgi:hypothetical protein
MRLFSLKLIGISGVLIAAGCSSNSVVYPEVADVVGVVTLDGQPLEAATITFVPEAGRSSSGVTDSSGKYSLHYTGTIRGAMLGTHRVMIKKMVPDKKFTASAVEQFMDKATSQMLKSSGLPTTTAADETGKQPLKPLMINAVGPQYSGLESILTASVKPDTNELDFHLVTE